LISDQRENKSNAGAPLTLFSHDEHQNKRASPSLYTTQKLKQINSVNTSKSYSQFLELTKKESRLKLKAKLQGQPRFTKVFHKYMRLAASKKDEGKKVVGKGKVAAQKKE